MVLKSPSYFICFLLLSGGAQSTEIVNFSQNLNAVISCPWNGGGYFKLPGFETCLKIGGQLEAGLISANLSSIEQTKFTDTAAYIESRLSFDTKTQMELFEFATLSSVKFVWDQETTKAAIEADRAALQISSDYFNLSAGIQKSLYTGFTGYSKLNLAGANWSDNKTLQATLKIPAGPITFGFSFEDVVYDDLNYNNFIAPSFYWLMRPELITKDDYTFIGMLEYKSKLMNVKLSGALMDVSGTDLYVTFPPNNDIGDEWRKNILNGQNSIYNYAMNFSGEIRPFENFHFSLGAQLGAGAMGYTGLDITNYQVTAVHAGSPTPFESSYPGVLFLNNDNGAFQEAILNYAGMPSYTLMGGFQLHLIEDVFLNFDASYQAFDINQGNIDLRANGFDVQSSLIWRPTTALGLSFGAGYSNYAFKGSVDIYTIDGSFDHIEFASQNDNFKIGGRIKYTLDPSS